MKKIIAAVAATGLLCIGAAAPASAETLYRNGANKVTITAQGAPARAHVDQGQASRSRRARRLSPGTRSPTRQRRASTRSPRLSRTTPRHAMCRALRPPRSCPLRVRHGPRGARHQPQRRQQHRAAVDILTGLHGGLGVYSWAGRHHLHGSCTATLWSTDDYDSGPIAWTDKWTEIQSVYETMDMTRAQYNRSTRGVAGDELAKNSSVLYASFVGDVVLYPGDGTELDKAGPITVTVPGEWQTIPATPMTTVKSTRTVVVN